MPKGQGAGGGAGRRGMPKGQGAGGWAGRRGCPKARGRANDHEQRPGTCSLLAASQPAQVMSTHLSLSRATLGFQ